MRVLDPACGSGNFLYVTLEHLKRLEGEVTEYLAHFPRQLGLDMTGGYTVTPQQLLGLEVNPRAAAIADVVLWIGYLQWHFRAHGSAHRLGNPILREYGNIKQQDAVLSYIDKKPRLDSSGAPITRWDGHTTKQHPVTGLEVPDETARTVVYDYIDPHPAAWPEADFIVGNPPFIGPARMREALGDGYTEALRQAYKGAVPESADFVMFWWHKAADLVKSGKGARFGFITTNSIKQTFNRRVLQAHMDDKNHLSIVYAIPDHPWVDSSDGAAVRIAMTVGEAGINEGRVDNLIEEVETGELEIKVKFEESTGIVRSNLAVGADIASTVSLISNEGIAVKGFELGSQGFLVAKNIAEEWLQKDSTLAEVIKPYMNGSDLVKGVSDRYVIDFFGFTEKQAMNYGVPYQTVTNLVKPERVINREARTANNWWLFRRSGEGIRKPLNNLSRFIGTTRTAKHRVFQFLPNNLIAESKIVIIATEDAFILGVLSSKPHLKWTLSYGAYVGERSNYNHSECFNTFPFPSPTEAQKLQIRSLAEQLDAHRKQRLAQHPALTITDMYNILEKLRAGEPLNAKDKKIYEHGLVSILKQLHDELDAAVAAAYGWPVNLPEEEILERLVALNKERAAEEARGIVRWLRPGYQNPGGVQQAGIEVAAEGEETATHAADLAPWPKTLAEQAAAVQRALQVQERPVSAEDLARHFKPVAKAQQGQRLQQIDSLLQTLQGLGLLRRTEGGMYVK